MLVPYRGDGGPRDQAWAYVRRWYQTKWPGWQVVQGACPPGPWVKAHGLGAAFARSDGDILVVSDADVACDGLGLAVAAVETGVAPWAAPHRRVYRLTADATARVLAGQPMPDIPARTPRRRTPGTRPKPWRAPDYAEVHTAMLGGGLVVLPRTLYEQVPMDPRFQGWGGEDAAFGHALSLLAGRPFRGTAPCMHLHHPPQERITRAVGGIESRDLARRYRAATTPDQVRAILAEIHDAPGPASGGVAVTLPGS